MQDEKDKIGWSRNLTIKEVRKWLEDNLSPQARYDIHLVQLSETEYMIRMYWPKTP